MNVSPHHQRPTKYPWPGRASAATLIVGLALVAVIAFILIADPFANDSGERDAEAIRGTAALHV